MPVRGCRADRSTRGLALGHHCATLAALPFTSHRRESELMVYAVVVSAIVLGLSVLASIAKFLDWFMHSDPRTMIRTTRWMLLLLLFACIPLLVTMIIN